MVVPVVSPLVSGSEHRIQVRNSGSMSYKRRRGIASHPEDPCGGEQQQEQVGGGSKKGGHVILAERFGGPNTQIKTPIGPFGD
jgi:hypothetical protein